MYRDPRAGYVPRGEAGGVRVGRRAGGALCAAIDGMGPLRRSLALSLAFALPRTWRLGLQNLVKGEVVSIDASVVDGSEADSDGIPHLGVLVNHHNIALLTVPVALWSCDPHSGPLGDHLWRGLRCRSRRSSIGRTHTQPGRWHESRATGAAQRHARRQHHQGRQDGDRHQELHRVACLTENRGGRAAQVGLLLVPTTAFQCLQRSAGGERESLQEVVN
mmetsp:Transcript_19320/g.46666  ORF Transcript_19320/g.46666 Transcript_19320/m.46666 type:complete len:219 (+) Transcript_19320:1889-2545(+)